MYITISQGLLSPTGLANQANVSANELLEVEDVRSNLTVRSSKPQSATGSLTKRNANAKLVKS